METLLACTPLFRHAEAQGVPRKELMGAMARTFGTVGVPRCTLRGRIETYRNLGGVWGYHLRDAEVHREGDWTIPVGEMRLVLVHHAVAPPPGKRTSESEADARATGDRFAKRVLFELNGALEEPEHVRRDLLTQTYASWHNRRVDESVREPLVPPSRYGDDPPCDQWAFGSFDQSPKKVASKQQDKRQGTLTAASLHTRAHGDLHFTHMRMELIF